jgi:hypothetical protein
MAKNNQLKVAVFNSDFNQELYYLYKTHLDSFVINEFNKKANYCVASFSDKEIVSYTFDVEKGLSQDKLDDSVEIKMFQDAGLNHLIEYHIVYSYRDSLIDAKKVTVTAFAITSSYFNSEFANFLTKCQYIDTILPHSTLPYALYNADILEKKSDVFVYFKDNDLMISIFYEGEYVYSKNSHYGLKQLHEQFVRNNNEGVMFETFIKAIIQKGVDESLYNSTDEVHIQDLTPLFERVLGEISTVLNYAKRISGISAYDRIFIGSIYGVVPKLADFSKQILLIQTDDFNFTTQFYSPKDSYIDQNIVLLSLEALNVLSNKKANPFNLTIFKRPPRFYKRDSGKFIFLTFFAFVASMAYPLYLVSDINYKNYQLNFAIQNLNISKGEFLRLKNIEEKIKQDKKKYTQMLNEKQKKLKQRVDLLENILDKKTKISSKIPILNTIFSQISKNNVIIKKLNIDKNKFIISVLSKNDRNFTKLLGSFTDTKDFQVFMSSFVFDSKQNLFKTIITVEVSR